MKNIAIFASGSGTNFEALVQACEDKRIDAKVVLMVCDHKDAYVCKRAINHNVDSFIFKAKDYKSKESYETEIVNKLKEYNVDLICLAGYMRICGKVLLDNYEGKILNIHPALLPAFKGAHAIHDAYMYGVKVFGITIHYIDSEMDCGTIVAQKSFDYVEGETEDQVEQRIHALEHELYPQVVAKICQGE